MGLTVTGLLDTIDPKGFVLCAGFNGLKNPIMDVGILDHEFDLMKNKEQPYFEPCSIVVSSLLFMKDNPEQLLPTIQQLLQDKVSSLAIQNVYFKDIPLAVLNYCNEKNFPLFLLTEEADYLENLIFKIKNSIHQADYLNYLEHSFQQLLNGDEHNFASLYQQLSLVLKPQSRAYLIEKQDQAVFSLREYDQFKRDIPQAAFLTRWKNKLFVLTTLELTFPPGFKSNLIGGCSSNQEQNKDLAQLFEESLLALEANNQFGKIFHYDDLGILALIGKMKLNTGITKLVDKLMAELQADFGIEVFQTVLIFFAANGDIQKTADTLFIHPNTVRYRIKTVCNKLGFQSEFELIANYCLLFKIRK